MLLWWTVLCLFAAQGSTSLGADSARVCLTAVDEKSAEMVLNESAPLQPGQRVLVHLDASTECTALLLPLLQGNSQLANGWRPQVVELSAWTEKVLPAASVKWEGQKKNDPFELWVLFFRSDAPAVAELQKLVSAMQQSNVSEQLLVQQTRKLCDKLASRMSGNAKIAHGPKADSALVGGTARQANFPWRDYATKVVLNDALEGELVLRHGR